MMGRPLYSEEPDWLRPLADKNEIVSGLWMGSLPSKAPEGVVAIVDCLGTIPYDVPYGVVYVNAGFEDSNNLPAQAWLEAIADTVNALRPLGPVLVHCHAGLNRSGLVTALALIRSGMPPVDAIRLLREKRDGTCLCNKTFATWLEKYDWLQIEAVSKVA